MSDFEMKAMPVFVPHEVSRLVITGSDRTKFLHGFCTADIKRMQPGEIREAFVLNTKGKLVGHVQVLCCEDRLELIGWPGNAAVLQTHFDRYVIREKVEFAVEDSCSAWFVFGAGDFSATGLGAVKPGCWQRQVLGSVPVCVAAGDFVGPGWLIVPADGPSDGGWSEVRPALLAETGMEAGDAQQVERHRIEHRFPKFGVDADGETLPQELQRDAEAISFDKGCYLGQETVARIDALGHVNRLLVKVLAEQPEVPALPVELRQGEIRVGMMTSAVRQGERIVGLAMVKRAAAVSGKQLECGAALYEVI